MGRQLISVVLLASLVAQAAPPPRPPPTPPPTPPPADLPPPPPPPPPAAVECFPACRPGFFCFQGVCKSACNPPCAAGETCLDNGQCAAGGDAPPPPPPDEPAGPRPPGGLMVSDDGEQAPVGFHWETQRRKGMLIAGPVLLGIGFAFSAFYGLFGFAFAGISLTGSNQTSSWIYRNRLTYFVNFVPVVGPAVAEVMFATSPGFRGTGQFQALEYAWVVVLTALQVSGALLIGFGIPTHQVLVEDKRADAKSPSLLDGLSVQFAPSAPGAPAGVSAFGTF